ncbi:radical SAM protein [Candidatus Bathyarchaeota archaeon]|nr:radical SAM protein [Candidatus Bathyarchaeota archaeon]
MKPLYLSSYEHGELKEKVERLHCILESCELCPRKCGVNRLKGEKGYCRSGKDLIVSSFNPHFGEEEPLVGTGGSGTIFLTNCNLLCVYCQNYEISHLGYGRPASEEKMADYMIHLQRKGCHNINFVTPTHFTPQLTRSIEIAIPKGLHLPIVWNCGGYENVETIRLLEGIVDIYMPDIKYGSAESARKYSNAPDYFECCREAVKEMHRQVGDLVVEDGIAMRGLLIRHLVLPNDVAGSREVLKFIAEEISKNTYVNIMDQYRPIYRAYDYKELARPPTFREYKAVVDMAKELGLQRGETFRHTFAFEL